MAGSGPIVEFSCTCGQIQGHLPARPTHIGTHLACHCSDCRAAELYLNQPDPEPKPVGLFQTTPDAITLTQGAQNLALFRLSPRGPFRWYATCCKVPMFNTLAKPTLAFAALPVARLADPTSVGPVLAQVNMKQPDGKMTHKGMGRVAWAIAKRMLAARLSGRWRNTPFFDEHGAPVAQPTILSKDERAQLYPRYRKISG